MGEARALPWYVHIHNDDSGHTIYDAKHRVVAAWYNYSGPEKNAAELANSKQIVLAVNAHKALVAACEAVLAEHDMFVGKDCGCGVFAQVSAALALAKK